MLILLPPSESKSHEAAGARRPRRGPALDLSALSLHSPELTAARAAVIAEVSRISGRPDGVNLLGVSPRLADEVAANTRVPESATVPAAALYTGVLYDALDLASLRGAARARANRSIAVISALFGALRLTDRVPPYRLSMGTTLPGLGALAAHWRGPLDPVLTAAAGRGVIVDCRSSTYAAAWKPTGLAAKHWVSVQVPGATHHAKHTRGLVARALCAAPSTARTPADLLGVLAEDFEARVLEPPRPGRPWVLQVTPR